jgi:hypothetical protein
VDEFNSSMHSNFDPKQGWFEITIEAKQTIFVIVDSNLNTNGTAGEIGEDVSPVSKLHAMMSDPGIHGFPSALPAATLSIPRPGTYSVEKDQIQVVEDEGCPVGFGSCTSNQCLDDLLSDYLNCGSCGNPCLMDDHTENVSCRQGKCVIQCVVGYHLEGEDCVANS